MSGMELVYTTFDGAISINFSCAYFFKFFSFYFMSTWFGLQISIF